MTTCEHGSNGNHIGTAGQDEKSSCCGAHVTYSGDGDLYCKCCYATIDWADDLADVGMIHIFDVTDA